MGFVERRTDVLTDLRNGRREALDQIIVTAYDELRDIAHRQRFARDNHGSLATTALVQRCTSRSSINRTRVGMIGRISWRSPR